MTDEEIKQKADRQYFTHYEEDYHYFDRSDLELYEDGYKDGYEQGYEDCRHYAHDYYKPKWHNLRKNPNDLPKEKGFYLVKVHGDNKPYIGEIRLGYLNNCWFGYFNSIINPVIAWCELPKFEEYTE